jgi:hypothetical protein
MKHDLFVLNSSGLRASATYVQAIDEYIAEVEANPGEDIYDTEFGFERGFWKAVEILSGVKPEYR